MNNLQLPAPSFFDRLRDLLPGNKPAPVLHDGCQVEILKTITLVSKKDETWNLTPGLATLTKSVETGVDPDKKKKEILEVVYLKIEGTPVGAPQAYWEAQIEKGAVRVVN